MKLRKMKLRRRSAVVLPCGILVLTITGCTAEGHTEPSPPSVTVAVPTEEAEKTTPPPTITTAPSSAATTAEAPVGAVPDVTGMRLSDGEVLLRGHGFLAINVVDASGEGRMVIEADNWVIISQDPPGGSEVSAREPVTLSVGKPTDNQSVDVVDGVVPDVVCQNLQSAQEALRAAGYYLLRSTDGLGQGRVPLLDRNWVVVGQSVPAGSQPPTSTLIELSVVKYGEPTGYSECAS